MYNIVTKLLNYERNSIGTAPLLIAQNNNNYNGPLHQYNTIPIIQTFRRISPVNHTTGYWYNDSSYDQPILK